MCVNVSTKYDGSYGDSSRAKPLIFILSPGSDPLSKIEKLAKSMGVADKLKVYYRYIIDKVL